MNNNLNNQYQQNSGATSADSQNNKIQNSINNINTAMNALSNTKSDNAFDRIKGIAQIAAMLMV